ncbi:MAG: WG repeat-containing protein [bacterium]
MQTDCSVIKLDLQKLKKNLEDFELEFQGFLQAGKSTDFKDIEASFASVSELFCALSEKSDPNQIKFRDRIAKIHGFNFLSKFSEGRAFGEKDEELFIVDQEGGVKNRFSKGACLVSHFSDGMAVVKIKNKHVYLNKDGYICGYGGFSDGEFVYASQFANGRAIVKKSIDSSPYYFIDKKGNKLEEESKIFREVRSGFGVDKSNDGVVIIHGGVSGDLILDQSYTQICDLPSLNYSQYSEGVITGKQGDEFVFYDVATRKVFHEGEYQEVDGYSNGYTRVKDLEGNEYFLDLKGEVCFEGYESVKSFSEGYAVVSTRFTQEYEDEHGNNLPDESEEYLRYNFIDTNGVILLEVWQFEVHSFKEGYAKVKNEYPGNEEFLTWSFIDKQGQLNKYFTNFESEYDPSDVCNGITFTSSRIMGNDVVYDGYTMEGKEIIRDIAQFYGYKDGLWQVRKDESDESFYINKKGETIFTPKKLEPEYEEDWDDD